MYRDLHRVQPTVLGRDRAIRGPAFRAVALKEKDGFQAETSGLRQPATNNFLSVAETSRGKAFFLGCPQSVGISVKRGGRKS